jgi:hypothetical protein
MVMPASDDGFGGKFGISLQFGTHIQRLGLMYQFYYFNSFVQISQGTSFHYNWKSLGPRKRGLEMQALLGLQFYWGEKSDRKKYLLNEYSLMAADKFSGGIMWRYYLDQVESSQSTGGLHFNLQQFGIIFENDLFGGTDGFQDKFRTGAMGITYQVDSLQLILQTTHWTGKAFDGPKVYDSLYPGKYGYRDLSNVKYGKYSHGILSLGINYFWKYNQTFRFESGIDAEQVRHALQNKLIHDFPLLPHQGKYENMHYPMLQPDGTPYTFREGQSIRKPRFYLQAGANPFMFY